jgi:hypothetical protein
MKNSFYVVTFLLGLAYTVPFTLATALVPDSNVEDAKNDTISKVSPKFVEFLQQDLQSLIKDFKGNGCFSRCRDNLFYIRKMQTGHNYKSVSVNIFVIFFLIKNTFFTVT